jgi:putative transposase
MGWKVKDMQEQRFCFIEEYRREELSLSALCHSYGISRPTAYKWIERYEEQGLGGLQDQSRAPHHPARAMAEGVKELILAVKAKHAFWGARKIVAHLEAQSPQQDWPAASSVGELLKRHGLTVSRQRRAHQQAANHPLVHADQSNRVWSVDFKGWFRTGDGQRCDPLTLTDNYSRYLLRCQALWAETTVNVKPVMEAAFREYGLPERIRSDNGAPFGSGGASGLTALSVWWIRLGIVPERIKPGCPQQNGRHERMHLTLKQETADPPAATLRQQQQRFDTFRQEYNQQRPHEALQQKPPAKFYQASCRPYPARLPQMEYPSGWLVRRVCSGGKFRHGGQLRFISHALVGELIGLEPMDDGYWQSWFGGYLVGVLDQTKARMYTPGEWQRKLERQAAAKAKA